MAYCLKAFQGTSRQMHCLASILVLLRHLRLGPGSDVLLRCDRAKRLIVIGYAKPKKSLSDKTKLEPLRSVRCVGFLAH